MPIDFSKLSPEDISAIASGDTSKLSQEGISALQQDTQAEPRGFASYAGEALTKIPQGFGEFVSGRGGGETLAQGAEAAVRSLGTPSAIRNIPPLAMAVMAPPTALRGMVAEAAQPYATALSSALTAGTAYVASKLAGDTNADATKNAIQSSYVGREIAPAERLFGTALKEAGKETLTLMGITAGSETAKRTMEAGRPASYSSLAEAWNDLKYQPAFGSFAGALRGVSSKAQFQQKLVEDARRDIGAFVNADEITLGMIDPANYATIEANIAANNPKLFAQISKVGASITDRYNSLFGKIEHPGAIATELNKYAGKLDEEKSTLANLQDARVKAEQQLADAQAMQLPQAQQNEIRARITASKMAEVNQNARVLYWDNLNKSTLGKLPRSSDSAASFIDSVSQIFEQRSEAAAQAYEASGVPFKDKFIPVKELVTAARRAISERRGPIADAMIGRIEEMGGKKGLISVNDMRDMRRAFSEMFPTAEGAQLDSVEAIAKLIYGGVTRKTSSIIERTLGSDVASRFEDVNSWWGETANAQNSRYMRQLTSPEPSKNMIAGLAQDIAQGRMQDVEKFGEFIGSISKLAPDVATLGSDALHKAVRESFIINASTGSNSIDFKKLTEMLNAASSRIRKTDPISIEAIGFGNRKQLSEVLSAYREYGANGSKITTETLDEFYSNPLVRQQIAQGKSLTVLARKSAAKAAFEREINTQMLAEISSAKIGSESYQRAKLAADRAGVSVQEQEQIVAKLKRGDIYSAFENMPQIGVNAFNGREGQITAMFQQMNPKDAKRIFEAIQSQRPGLADKIEKRVVADLLNYATSNTTSPNQIWTIDGKKIIEMFNPNLQDKGNPIHLLRELMPKQKFNEFKSSLSAFSRLSDYEKYGGIANMPKDMLTAFGIGGALAMNRPGGSAGSIGLAKQIFNMGNGIKYNLAAALLTDKDLSRAYFGLGNISGPAATAGARLELMLRDDKELAAEFGAGGANR
jgi:hypothetical protein